jgi:hypothetical protein
VFGPQQQQQKKKKKREREKEITTSLKKTWFICPHFHYLKILVMLLLISPIKINLVYDYLAPGFILLSATPLISLNGMASLL